MGRFRKKPVVIEAFQLTPETRKSNYDWPNWAHDAWQKRSSEVNSLSCNPPDVQSVDDPPAMPLYIRTLEGVMAVIYGDWIIQGVKGELYPCKPDIFAATYEPASESIPA